MIKSILIVGAGSFLGGAARYLLSKLVQDHASGIFPWGTFVVNILGCFFIGFVYGLLDRNFDMSPAMKLFITTGFCGGFTTFSTFIHENYLLFSPSGMPVFALYAAGSLVAGLLCAWAGHALVNFEF